MSRSARALYFDRPVDARLSLSEFIETYVNNPRYLQALFDAAAVAAAAAADRQYAPVASNELDGNNRATAEQGKLINTRR